MPTIPNLPPGDPRKKGTPPPLTERISLQGMKKGADSLDPDAINKELTQLDQENYARAHADWLRRGFGPLDQARTLGISQALSPLRGGGDPYLQGVLGRSGLGDVNLGKTEKEINQNLGQPIAHRDNRSRDYFAKLLQENPEHQFGLTSTDVANIGATNAHVARIDNSARVQSQQNAGIAAAAQSAQTTGAIASGIGGAIQAIGKNTNGFGLNSYLNPSSYAGPSGSFYGLGTGAFNPNVAANMQLPASDPDFGNANFIGLGDSAGGAASGGGW